MKQPKRKKTIHEESEPTYQFQRKYARSQHWFDIDPDWIEDTSMTRDPVFFKSLHLKIIPVQNNKD